MFKLESYITPILLNYVAKYVKDLRDEDAQVSLWEGEVTFQNLDLRLDVLEEELNLPFELVSGHIHELSIQVPWTKLTSEPVRIEINTIEFVAKLPNEEEKKQQLAERRRQKQSTAEGMEQPQGPGISSGVANKIINNITLQCHNIILKYVEDDIVVSMNVQYLNFSSADEKWQPAMVDVNPVTVLMRKLLQVSDLTICLDKRNTAGRIEVCQEPILYRCTLECRVLRKYNVNTVSTSSTTRIGVFTKSLDINVSSLQFPMVMRLVKMLLELKPAAVEEDVFNLQENKEPQTSSNAEQGVAADKQTGMFGWAWNLLPSFEQTLPAENEHIGHAFDVGVYAEELNFQLKNSELFIDQAMGGIKRIRYTPIMRISLGGIYYERSQLKENDWANVRAGLSSLNMEPLGIYRSDDPLDNKLVNTKEFQKETAFIDKSLFDVNYTYADRNWCSNNHDDYFARNTDEYMLFRSPVLAFDIVEYRAPRQGGKGHVTTGAQIKDAGHRVKYRLLSSGITFHFSQSFLQVKNVISDLLRPYDYSGYHAESSNETIHRPVSSDQEYPNLYMTYADFEYLIGFMPICNYRIHLRNMTVQFYPRQQGAESSTTTNQHKLSTTVCQSLLPYLQLNISQVEGTICGPANPQRLVHLITRLQDKPREVIDTCYKIYDLNVKNLTFMALNTTPAMGKAKLVHIPSMQVQFNRLVLPHLWRPNVAALETAEIESQLITLEFSKRELVLVNRMLKLIMRYDSDQLSSLARLVARGNQSTDVIKLQTLVTKLRCNYRKYHTHKAMLLTLRNLNTDVFHKMMNVRNVVISTNKGTQNKWLELQLQIPYQDSDAADKKATKVPATAICLWLENYRVTLDIHLMQFFNSFAFEDCQELVEDGDSDTISLSEKQPWTSNNSYTSLPPLKLVNAETQSRRTLRSSRKVSVPEETIHLSSERDEKVLPQPEVPKPEPSIESTTNLDFSKYLQMLTTIVVTVEMAKSRIDVCEAMLRKEKDKEQTAEYTSIRLPLIKIKSSNCEDVARGNIRKVINTINNSELCKWEINMNEFMVCLKRGTHKDIVVAPVQTTITIALSRKISGRLKPKLDVDDSFIDQMPKSQQKKKKVDWNKVEEEINEDEAQQTCSINVHVDMSEIQLYGHRLKLLLEHSMILYEIYKAIYYFDGIAKCAAAAAHHDLQIFTGSAQHYPVIKQFLDLDPELEPPLKGEDELNAVFFIIFCQWTIPRISLELETEGVRNHRKIVVNFEDLLLNVDKHPDFTKITSKVENIGLSYYETKAVGEWNNIDDFHIKMLGDNTNMPMISVVVTTVSLKDLYSKIGARSLYNKRHTITELIIDLQPIELILDLDRITEFFIYQCEVLELLQKDNHVRRTGSDAQYSRKDIMTVQDMPIVHLNSKGFYLYIPMKTEKKCCTVLLLKIESIKLLPTVDNPLVRHLIRNDVYNKAAELNMLNTPGSLLEDRQYELSVRRISLSSGNWLQMQQLRLERKLAIEHNNPALEWNNQTDSIELDHKDIFKDFDFVTIYAPVMSYDKFMVAGEIIEYNCVTDFEATLNTHQIQLISCITKRLQRLQSILEYNCSETLSSKADAVTAIGKSLVDNSYLGNKMSQIVIHNNPSAKEASGSFQGSCQSDSGINMSKGILQQSITPHWQSVGSGDTMSSNRQKQGYPRSVSFVAGKFTLQIFDVVELEDELLMKPLILITISQPSFLSQKTTRAVTKQASIFDFNVSLAKTQRERELVPEVAATSPDNFSEFIFDTLPGNSGSSGIPPPLFSVKANRDRSQQMEVDMELGKPMLIRLCQTSVNLLMSDLMRIYTLLYETPYFAVRSEKPVVKTTPLHQLKLYCFDADRLHLVCNQLTVKFYDERKSFECSAIFLDVNANVKFNFRPNKASIKATLGSFYVQVGKRIFLHPLLMRLSADLSSVSWSDQLLVAATLKMNLLHVDASVVNILQLKRAKEKLDNILEHLNVEWQMFLQSRPQLGQPEDMPLNSLLVYKPHHTQIVHSKTSLKHKAEFYQDDLRAGAFQFVYLSTDTMLPMPYQVQIIKKNYGIICWRYPQPRQMHKIFIFPVPMPVDNPIHIKCRMEYFSETHETFLHYCDFELSELSSKELTPPERSICATIWRVVIMQSLISVDGTCFDIDEDEELQSIESSQVAQDFKGNLDNDFMLDPKVLVGCMRIDTKFHPELVPKLQLLLSCQDIAVKFLNLPDASSELPPLLKNYNLKDVNELMKAFLCVRLNNLQIHSDIFSRSNFSVESDFRMHIKCLDYGFLNMMDILEPMTFRSYFRLDRIQRQLKANLMMDKLRINCGPWVMHTLLSSKQHWQEMMTRDTTVNTLMPRCVIVNRLTTPIIFGQTGTSERITAHSQDLCLYYFCSDCHGQELTFYKTNAETNMIEVSESVHIPLKFEEEHRIRHVRMGNSCLTIKQGKLSATQVYILLKGQIEVVNMSPLELVTEFRAAGLDEKSQHPLPTNLKGNGRASFYQPVLRNEDIVMRLKLSSDQGKGRTGDIPLKTNNSLPWLVKVPTVLPQQFISLWVRILREDVSLDKVEDGFQPQRILVSIWPIFQIRNLLNCEMRARETSTNENYSIMHQGGRQALNTATTHTTEHRVEFEFPVELGSFLPSDYTFMLKSMDWHKFFHYDPVEWTIENTLHKLDKTLEPNWPLNDVEELHVQRYVRLRHKFDLQYCLKATREFSCTLGLDVAPWAMLINATSVDVSLFLPKESARYSINANCLEMLPVLNSHFTIDIRIGASWISSMPICMDQQQSQPAPTPIGSPRPTVLRLNSFVDIVVMRNEHVYRLMLEFKMEDGRRVLKLRSKYVVANFSDVEMLALPLTLDHKETANRKQINTDDLIQSTRNLGSCSSKKQSIGVSMEMFYDLNARQVKHTSDTAFVYFMCFAVQNSLDVSIPIPLAIPFTRRCFSLQHGRDSIPLTITLIEKENVYYLNVFRDSSPTIIINNNTNVRYIVAQTTASGNSNVTCVTPELVGKHFEWNQLIAPYSKCYYTPPQMYANFPDVEYSMCNLSMALYNPDACGKSKIGWSKPIRTDKSWQKFMHVPNHGDIKVVICDKHRVIRLNIYYIAQQLEFSVKDLRSRLVRPDEERQSMLSVQSSIPSQIVPEHPEEEKHIIEDCSHFKEECENKLQLQLRLFLKSFVFSLQTNDREKDYLKTEVCNMYADDVMLAYDDDDDQRELHLQLPNLQVDNQLYSTGRYDFPVLLCAQQLYRRNCHMPQIYDLDAVYKRQAERKSVSLLSFIFYQDEMQLQDVCCQLQPLRVYIEDAYLNQLLDTLVECEPSNCVYIPQPDNGRIILEDGHVLLPASVVAQAVYISEPLRLNTFVVEPLSLLLSVHTSSRLYIALDHSPLSFSRYERQQILTVPLRFGQSLGLHYLSGAIFGAGWVVGSLEILGSPSGLARSFSTGLRDFISMPVEGLFRGPWGFLVGITQGSASLLRNVTAGTVNSVTKLAGSVARNLDRLTLDSEHIELTEARRRARPQGFADGLTQGLTGLGISLLGAVGGIAHHTLEARTSVGVLTGLTKGIVGALTKPISGAAEMLALTGQGVLHTVGFNTMPQQVEPSTSRNAALHASSFRIWRFLPRQLHSDQILVFQDITLMLNGQLRPALLFVTSSVLAILEMGCDDLTFIASVLKVVVVADREDPSKLYLSLKPEQTDDMEGQLRYTNERIISFLNAARNHVRVNDSLTDLLQVNEHEEDIDHLQRQTQCIFLIKPNMGEHLMYYLKVIRQTQ